MKKIELLPTGLRLVLANTDPEAQQLLMEMLLQALGKDHGWRQARQHILQNIRGQSFEFVATTIEVVATTQPLFASEWLNLAAQEFDSQIYLGDYYLGIVLGTFRALGKLAWTTKLVDHLKIHIYGWATHPRYYRDGVKSQLLQSGFVNKYESMLQQAMQSCFWPTQGCEIDEDEQRVRTIELCKFFHKLQTQGNLDGIKSSEPNLLASMLLRKLVYRYIGSLTLKEQIAALCLFQDKKIAYNPWD